MPTRYIERRCGACGCVSRAVDGAYLKSLREAKGLSLRAAAKAIGIAHTTLLAYERNSVGYAVRGEDHPIAIFYQLGGIWAKL